MQTVEDESDKSSPTDSESLTGAELHLTSAALLSLVASFAETDTVNESIDSNDSIAHCDRW
jgi:hypothetical protein